MNPNERQAIPVVDGPGLLTYSARAAIQAEIENLCRLLGVEPVYALTDAPGGRCHLEMDLMFVAATVNKRSE